MGLGVESPEEELAFGSGVVGRDVEGDGDDDDDSLSRFLDSALILDVMIGIRNMQIHCGKERRIWPIKYSNVIGPGQR